VAACSASRLQSEVELLEAVRPPRVVAGELEDALEPAGDRVAVREAGRRLSPPGE
jgi:hypothetical protein